MTDPVHETRDRARIIQPGSPAHPIDHKGRRAVFGFRREGAGPPRARFPAWAYYFLWVLM